MKDTEASRDAGKTRPVTETPGKVECAKDIPRIDSGLLLGTAGRVVIEHHGQRYELRETRYGKLILTK
ncbi:MAG TPA: hemin uptake protein HemP [Wenzhouxiangellaceae bacterium]|nr:hemin uptake protein HemP [Wenzhouxiangellaceae bacterium]